MEKYLILCRSLTGAQRAARLLERTGIAVTVAKAPAGLTDRGCSYGVRVSAARGPQAVRALDEAGLEHGRVFLLRADGSAVEVEA